MSSHVMKPEVQGSTQMYRAANKWHRTAHKGYRRDYKGAECCPYTAVMATNTAGPRERRDHGPRVLGQSAPSVRHSDQWAGESHLKDQWRVGLKFPDTQTLEIGDPADTNASFTVAPEQGGQGQGGVCQNRRPIFRERGRDRDDKDYTVVAPSVAGDQ